MENENKINTSYDLQKNNGNRFIKLNTVFLLIVIDSCNIFLLTHILAYLTETLVYAILLLTLSNVNTTSPLHL